MIGSFKCLMRYVTSFKCTLKTYKSCTKVTVANPVSNTLIISLIIIMFTVSITASSTRVECNCLLILVFRTLLFLLMLLGALALLMVAAVNVPMGMYSLSYIFSKVGLMRCFSCKCGSNSAVPINFASCSCTANGGNCQCDGYVLTSRLLLQDS